MFYTKFAKICHQITVPYTVKKLKKQNNHILVSNKDIAKLLADLNLRSCNEQLIIFSRKSERKKFFQPLVGFEKGRHFSQVMTV